MLLGYKKLLMFMIIGIFLAGTVSALDFSVDNYKQTKESSNQYPIIELWDKGQIGEDIKLIEYKLEENSEQCLINCYAEGTAKIEQKMSLFENLRFEDGTKEVSIKNSKIYIEVEEEYTVNVPNYKSVCVENATGGEACVGELESIEKVKRTRIIWKEYNFESLPIGEYKWRIEGTKDKEQTVDWIFENAGIDGTEWAWWNYNWDYKKQVNWTNLYGEDINHYPVAGTLDHGGNAQADGGDIRVLLNDTTELEFGLQTISASIFNITYKINASAGGVMPVYVYYGNPVSINTNVSWNNARYNVYDDVEDGILNGDYYIADTSTDEGDWSAVGGGELVETYSILGNGSGNNDNYLVIAEGYPNVQVKITGKVATTSGGISVCTRWHELGEGRTYCAGAYPTTDGYNIETGGNTSCNSFYDSSLNEAINLTFSIIGGEYLNLSATWDMGVESCTATNTTWATPYEANNSGNVTLKIYGESRASYFDEIKIRNYVYPEPTYLVSGEEGMTGLTTPFIDFLAPTPLADTNQSQNGLEVSANIIEPNLNKLIYNWNGTNYSMYDDGLVLMYNFDNVSALGENNSDVVDVSGAGNDGIVTGATWNSTGKYGGAFEFDGSGEINLGDVDSTENIDELSIALWVKFNSDGACTFVSKDRYYDSGASYSLEFIGSDRWNFAVSNSRYRWIRLTSEIGRWYFLTGTYSNLTNEMKIYIDAELRTGGADNGTFITIPDTSNDLIIGNNSDGDMFDGTIDEVRIYNRSLSADEITQLYYSNLNKYDTDKWLLYVNQTGLDDGVYTYYGWASNATSFTNITDIRGITIDTIPVNITLLEPADATINNSATQNFTANITDNLGIKNATLYVYNDSGLFNSSTTTYGEGVFSTIIGFVYNLPDTVYTWFYETFDWAEESTISENRTFTTDTTAPTVTLNIPADDYYSTGSVNFNCSAVDVNQVDNITLYIDTSINQTETISAISGQLADTLTFADGYYNWTCNAYDDLGQVGWATNRTFTIDNITPVVSITYPTNNTNHVSNLIDINISVTETNPQTCWWSNSSGTINNTLTDCGTNITGLTWDEGSNTVGLWTNDSAGNENSTSVVFTVDTVFPLITINSPTSANYTQRNINFNVTSNEALQSCYLSLDAGTTNYTMELTSNSLIANYTNSSMNTGDYLTNFYCTDIAGNLNAAESIGFGIKNFVQNNMTWNGSRYETETGNFMLNISWDNVLYSSVSANLIYNGTSYAGTKTGSGSDAIFKRTLYTPLLVNAQENRSFYWEVALDSTYSNSSSENQTVNAISMGYCNATLTAPYINFTYADEGSLDAINATVAASTWYYWLGAASVNRSFIYSNTTGAQMSHAFCAVPAARTFNTDLTYQYERTSYPQRRYSVSEVYTNTTTDKTLYLLSTADGLYVTFQVLSQADSPIENVYATADRQISGDWTEVASGFTGADGGVTFWLDSDYIHQLNFSKVGYDEVILSITPTQTQYTVYMGGGTTAEPSYDFSRGISYKILPTGNSLSNGTEYTFNFSLSSDYWDLTKYGFILRNGSGNWLGSVSGSAGSGGDTIWTTNVGFNQSISMEYYWLVGASNYTNRTQTWIVWNDYDTGWSLKTFFTDLKSYSGEDGNTGMFGLNGFSRTLIVFFLIFGIVGSLTYVSGITSPAAISWEVFALTAFFDLGVGLIGNPEGAITHFPTLFMFILAVGASIWEFGR